MEPLGILCPRLAGPEFGIWAGFGQKPPAFPGNIKFHHQPIVNPRKLEHRSRTIHAGIPYTLL